MNEELNFRGYAEGYGFPNCSGQAVGLLTFGGGEAAGAGYLNEKGYCDDSN